MFRINRYLAGAVSLVAMLAAESASAQSSAVSTEVIDRLQAQIKALEREVQALKGKTAAVEKTAEKAYAAVPPSVKTPAPPPTAIVKMSAGNRPSICTPDGLNCIAITSRLHFDTGGYWYSPNTVTAFNNPAGPPPQHLDSGLNARRARIGVLGTFMGDWNYSLVYDFGGTSDGFASTATAAGTAVSFLPGGILSGIQTAQLSYTGLKGNGVNVAIEGGYGDLPYTLDQATSSNDIMFMERASSQAIAAGIAAGDFRSHFGARAYNDWFWAGAYLTGPTSGAVHVGSTVNPVAMTEQYGAFGRVAMQVINEKAYSLHIGGDAQFLLKPAFNRVALTQTLTLSDRPELRIDPTALITTGAIPSVSGAQVYSAEVAGAYGPLFFQSEYFHYNVDRQAGLGLSSLQFDGGYAQASWTITGESRVYNAGAGAYGGIVPHDPFSLTSSGWGAWEVAARYSTVDLNDRLGFADGAAGGKQTIYTAGLNWYANRNVRFMLNYLHGTVIKQVSATNAADAGAKFDALAMRAQVAF